MPLFISNLYLERLFDPFDRLFDPFDRASSPSNSLLVSHRNKMRINDHVGSTFLHLYWTLHHIYCLSSCLKIFSCRRFFRPNQLTAPRSPMMYIICIQCRTQYEVDCSVLSNAKSQATCKRIKRNWTRLYGNNNFTGGKQPYVTNLTGGRVKKS